MVKGLDYFFPVEICIVTCVNKQKTAHRYVAVCIFGCSVFLYCIDITFVQFC